MKKNIETRVDRIIERLEILGSISEDNQCLSRFFGTTAHFKAKELLKEWMNAAGMQVIHDNIGNVRAILPGQSSESKHFVIGSHYDSVFDAGKYDGPLGILLGLEVAQKLSEAGIPLPFHLNILAFADEEGSRFNTAYLGSSVLAGNFDTTWLNRKDDKGLTLKEVISNAGGKLEAIIKDQIPAEAWLGYFEAHIEQGPVLDQENLPVCLVSGIAAQTRVDIKWKGMAGHAGTSPMNMRKDALCGAAEFTLTAEALGQKHQGQLVATIGKLNVAPNTSNVISGLVQCTLDIRSQDDTFLAEMVAILENKAQEIAQKRGLQCDWNIMQSNASVACDQQLTKVLRRGIKKAGIARLLEIPSGAGHDGVMISKVAPISMLFVRCKEGISHNPKEHVDREDIKASLLVCDCFLNELMLDVI